MIVLSDRDGMASLALHGSIWNGLCTDALETHPGSVTTLTLADGDKLSAWASACANPQGQKAALARAVVQLVRFAPGNVLRVERQLSGPAVGFWERTG